MKETRGNKSRRSSVKMLKFESIMSRLDNLSNDS